MAFELFGRCCGCDKARALEPMHLPKRAPVPGTGWGCMQCMLPLNGAVALMCAECLANQVEPRWAVRGPVWSGERVPVDALEGEFTHDLALHPEVRAKVGVN